MSTLRRRMIRAQVRSIQNKLISAGYLRAQYNGGTFARSPGMR